MKNALFSEQTHVPFDISGLRGTWHLQLCGMLLLYPAASFCRHLPLAQQSSFGRIAPLSGSLQQLRVVTRHFGMPSLLCVAHHRSA